MFSRRSLDVSALVPTSKLSLKLSCLEACNNDVKDAQALYDYIAEGMDLPDVDPVRPTTIDQIKQEAGNVYSWVSQHRDELLQAFQFVRSLKGNATTPATSGIPPIPKL